MSSSSPLWAHLRRSSPSSISRVPASTQRPIHPPDRSLPHPFSTAAAVYGGKGSAEGPSSPDRDIGGFLKALAAIVASGSALGLWLLSSPPSSSSSSSSSPSPLSSLSSPASASSFAPPARGDPQQGIEGMTQERKPRYLFGDAYRRRVFFNYEKRLRLQSPPEKVFEYFATFRTPEGEVFMTPADLMRAVVPVFPPSESNLVRDGYLRGEHRPGELHCSPSTFFMLFDTNNDGLISFAEYIFFVTLLSIPESSFSVAFKMFDIDNNGEIDREEFKKVMALMRSYNRQGACHRDGLRIGLKVGKSVENAGLVEYFFGTDGTGCLQHEKFIGFLRDLHDEIVRLEFAHYDCKSRGTISAKDFALSMVSSAEISHINKFLDRVDTVDHDLHLKDMRITLEEFKAFAELRHRLQPLSLAIFSYGKVNDLLTKQDFQRAAYNVCGIFLSDNIIDVVFHIFDVNRDGNLSSEEFLRAIHRRERDIRQPTSMGIAYCF